MLAFECRVDEDEVAAYVFNQVVLADGIASQ